MDITFRKGLVNGIGAYTLWGILPIYFYLLSRISAYEVVCHRILWSMVLLAGILLWQKRLFSSLGLLRSLKESFYLFIAGGLISINWFIYIYAVAAGKTVDASLGYFINPVIIILFGFLFFGERLNFAQKVCTAFASMGVLYQIFQSSTFSWISIVLPISFGFYGVIKKKSRCGSIQGLFLETLFMSPFALIYVLFLFQSDQLEFFRSSGVEFPLLLLAGVVTATPLLLFSEGAKRIPYTIMGFLQYIAPSFQFLLGVYAFGEELDFHKLVGFIFVWAGIAFLLTSEINRIRRPEKY